MELRPHNKKAYDNLIRMYKSGTRSAATIHPTGTGKTYITMQLVEDHPNENIIIVAPTNAIIDQYKKRFEENGIDVSNVTFLTYTKVMNMNDEELEELHANKVILDEFHHCGAQEWGQGIQRLIEKNMDANILGLSATPIRYLDNLRNMTDELFEGNIASEITLPEAILDGLLEIPDYHQGLYSIQNENAKLHERIKNLPEEELREELSKKLRDLSGSLTRMESTKQILEKAITSDKKSGRYIVFCRDIKDMHNAMKHAEEWFENINEIEMYSVSTKNVQGRNVEHSENQEKIEAFENSKSSKLKLMFAINILNEGVHINGIDGIIMLRSTKSPIIYRQQLGRVLAIDGKENPLVFDFADNISCTRYIYELYEEMSEIIKRRKAEGRDTTKEEAFIGKFKIDDHVKEMRELEKELDDLTYMDSSLVEETLRVAQILHENGVDLKHMKYIRNAKRLKLNELKQDGVDLEAIIRDNHLNPYFKMGLGVTVARLSYNDKSYFELTEEQREIALRTGIVKSELDYDKTQKLIHICQILKDNGVNISRIPTQRNNKRLLLKDIEQYGIDINEIIKKEGLEPLYPIGVEMTNFRMVYDTLTKEQQEVAEEIGILREDKTKLLMLETLKIASILKENGVKFEELLTYASTSLGDCEQPGIDFKKILKDYSLDPSFEFGRGRKMLLSAYQGTKYKGILNEEQLKQIKELGIASPPKKENNIDKALNLLEQIAAEGIDVSKISAKKRDGESAKYQLLSDVKIDGMDFGAIIEKLGLDPKAKIGIYISTLRESCAGRGTRITAEQKKRAEKLLRINEISQIEEFFEIAEILKQNGVIIHRLPKNKTFEDEARHFLTLQQLSQGEIDFEKIIQENNLEKTYRFGYMHNFVLTRYNAGKILTEEQRKRVEELGIVNTEPVRPMTYLISILTILKQEGVDLENITLSPNGNYILLKDVISEEIIKKHGLDSEYSLGIAIGRLRTACNGKGSERVTDEEKEKAEQLGILNNEVDLTEEAFKVIGILKKAGVSFKTLALTNNGKPIVLKDLQQKGFNLAKVIKDNELAEDYPIGRRIINIRMGYNEAENAKKLTPQQRKLAEKYDILKAEWRNDKSLKYFFKVIGVLKGAGVDISNVQWGTKRKKFTLGELDIPGVNLAKIIEENDLNPEYKIGSAVSKYRTRYNKKTLSEDEMKEGEELGVFAKPKEMSKVSELIYISKILIKNGIDIKKLKVSQTKNGKQRNLTLGELTYEGIDIQKIIKDNGLDTECPYGQRLQYACNAFAGYKGYLITEDEKRELIELELVDRRKILLQEKIKEAQELEERLKDAQELESQFEDLLGPKGQDK